MLLNVGPGRACQWAVARRGVGNLKCHALLPSEVPPHQKNSQKTIRSYLEMVLYDDREGLLLALQSMGIEFPSKTNLSMVDLDKKLRKALYLSQRMESKLKGSRLLDFSTLRNWSSVSSVCDVLEAQSTEVEIGASHSLTSWAMRMRRLDNRVFMDLENTIMFLARAFDNKVSANMLKGERGGYAIIIRVSSLCCEVSTDS